MDQLSNYLPASLVNDIFDEKSTENNCISDLSYYSSMSNSSESTTFSGDQVQGTNEADVGKKMKNFTMVPVQINCQTYRAPYGYTQNNQNYQNANFSSSPIWNASTITFQNQLKLLEGNLHHILKNAKASSVFQELITNLKPEYLDLIFEPLVSYWVDLMCNSSANPFCINFFKLCKYNQKLCIMKVIQSNFVQIAKTFFGSLAIQSMIEDCRNDYTLEAILLDSFNSPEDLITLCLNTFGCHVIKKIIECVRPERRIKFDYVILKNFEALAMHMHGVLILKEYVISCQNEPIRNEILKIISSDFIKFCQNEFGNYIVQQMIELKPYLSQGILTKIIEKNFVKLSMHRISSYVMEKYISVLKDSEMRKLVQKIQKEGKMAKIMSNKYGQIILTKMGITK